MATKTAAASDSAISTLHVLQAARSVIEKPENWCQEFLAVNSSGEQVDDSAPDACAWCAMGALWRTRVSPDKAYEVAALLRDLSGAVSLPEFNDTHSHSEVLSLFDRAIAAEQSKAGGR